MPGLRFACVIAALGLLSSPAVSGGACPSCKGTAASTQATRLDPYKNFRFRVEIGGQTVAGVSKVSMPAMPAVVEHRSGGDPSTAHKSPGRNKYEAITLERGLTQDVDFARWASSGAQHRPGPPATRELSIVMVDERGQPVTVYRVHRAWVSEYQTVPNLDARANAIAIEHIKLENEGWERGD